MFESKSPRIALAVLAVAAFAGGVSLAQAEMVQMKANLTSGAEVPPVNGAGKGQGTFTYDTATKQLKYQVTYSGLSGPAVAGHIHGPAAMGANAGVAVPFASAASPISGTATLNDAQAKDLMDGKMYVNIHTAANKGGEIRGQITK